LGGENFELGARLIDDAHGADAILGLAEKGEEEGDREGEEFGGHKMVNDLSGTAGKHQYSKQGFRDACGRRSDWSDQSVAVALTRWGILHTVLAMKLPGFLLLVIAAAAGAAETPEQTYLLRCAMCHQPTGLGAPPVYPPLAGSDWLKA